MVHQPTVMVVDDDANILFAFEDFFKAERCTMIAATCAEEALKKIEHHHIDLLITDVRLKFQSGVTFLLHMKANHPKLPVIVITGHPDLVTQHDVVSYGADYFFLKPLDLEKLRAAVRTSLHFNNHSN